MASTGTLVINGTDISKYIAIDGYNCSVQDVDFDAGRVASGRMKRNCVAQKRKLEVTFVAGMTDEQIKSVHDLMKPTATTNSFKVTSYLDPTQANAHGSGTFYAGDRTYPRHSDALGIWSSWSVSMVEI